MPGRRHVGGDQPRPARPLGTDSKDIVAGLAKRRVILHIDSSVHDPGDPLGPVLAMVADFQTALVRGRTTEGMRLARAKLVRQG